MNPAVFLIPPELDPKQALRLRRFGLAALAYALSALLVTVVWAFGVYPASATLELAAASLAVNLGVYVAIRSGFNLRFKDPSLTRFQILAAITFLMYIVYHMDDGRYVALFGCFFVFLFGVYRLDAREFTLITLYTLGAYAAVIGLLLHLRPQAIHNVHLEWMSWLMLACWLPLFSIIGGQMSGLRRRVRDSEVRFRSLTAMSSDFYWESDVEHRLTLVSAGGKTREAPAALRSALTGKRRWEIPYLLPDEAGWQAHRAALDARRPFRDFEFARADRDGAALHFSVSGDPVFDVSRAFSGYRGVGTDISVRKQSEAELAKLAAIVESSNDAIVSRSLDLRVWSWNAAAERMFGFSAAEAIGQNISELIIPPEREAEVAQMRAQLALGQAVLDFVTVRRAKDGTYIDVSLSQSPINDERGVMVGASVIYRDISERKRVEAAHIRLEAQLRESQKMEALGTLAGGIAHDFNNALAAILGNVELARQDLGPGHAALVSLNEIGKSSRRARDLVQQILAFGRRQKTDRKATSLALVVVETARLLRASIPANVSLDVHCAADTPSVLADATQFNQIVLNLCTNALQAVQNLGRPGVIEVRLESHTQVDMRGDLHPGRYARLTVRDNGAGMDEETQARIFEPFFTTKPAGKGTGLGLSVVHGIVKSHEANLEVESAPGLGSTFRIYFPAVDIPVTEVPPPAPDAVPVHGNGKHVLYVDDEEAIIFLMKRLLERQGFRVSSYADPRAALAAVQANPGQFDLVVTDFNMPGMSGLALAMALKQIRADLPVVLASGYITEELRQQAPAAGIRELIYKPNTVDELCEAVARIANAQSGNGISS